jgi:hypothetical protein
MLSLLPGKACHRALGAAALVAMSLLAGNTALAQSIVMAGNYQNFDVLNNTGGEACGFEMEIHGVSSPN